MLEIVDTPATHLAQLAERQRIARELHDGVVQSLCALVADLECFQGRKLAASNEADPRVVEKVQMWQSLARESLTSIRETLGTLRASSGLTADLPHALETLLLAMQDAGYHVEFECSEWPPRLTADYESHIYAIVREALTNISKHAHASCVRLNMFLFENRLYISITDDGVGIQQRPGAQRGGSGYSLGIVGMRERAALLGGSVTLESAEGKGTRVDIEIPPPEL